MGFNKWIGYGRLCADPEFRQTASGVAMCRFSVACDRRIANKETCERQADFINCIAWRQTADFIAKYFAKGSAIIVEGTLQNDNYTDNNGVKHYNMHILVEQVRFGESKRAAAQNAPEPQQKAAPQFGVVTPKAAQDSNTAQSGTSQTVQLDLSEFEEILSDNDIPF